jgi:hypothetical protein
MSTRTAKGGTLILRQAGRKQSAAAMIRGQRGLSIGAGVSAEDGEGGVVAEGGFAGEKMVLV